MNHRKTDSPGLFRVQIVIQQCFEFSYHATVDVVPRDELAVIKRMQ